MKLLFFRRFSMISTNAVVSLLFASILSLFLLSSTIPIYYLSNNKSSSIVVEAFHVQTTLSTQSLFTGGRRQRLSSFSFLTNIRPEKHQQQQQQKQKLLHSKQTKRLLTSSLLFVQQYFPLAVVQYNNNNNNNKYLQNLQALSSSDFENDDKKSNNSTTNNNQMEEEKNSSHDYIKGELVVIPSSEEEETKVSPPKFSILPGIRQRFRTSSNRNGVSVKDQLAALGLAAVLSYGWVSNMSYSVSVSLAWFIFSKRTGLSPLAPGQWKGFLAVYAGFFIFNNFVRPIRIGIAVGVAPTFDKVVLSLQNKFNINKATAVAVTVFLANIVGTISFMSIGIILASIAAGVPPFPKSAATAATSIVLSK